MRNLFGIIKSNFSPWWLRLKESACSAGDPGSIPGWGRSPGDGKGTPLQCSCLKTPIDRGAWLATVRGISKSQTWLSNEHFRFSLTTSPAPHLYSWCLGPRHQPGWAPPDAALSSSPPKSMRKGLRPSPSLCLLLGCLCGGGAVCPCMQPQQLSLPNALSERSQHRLCDTPALPYLEEPTFKIHAICPWHILLSMLFFRLTSPRPLFHHFPITALMVAGPKLQASRSSQAHLLH